MLALRTLSKCYISCNFILSIFYNLICYLIFFIGVFFELLHGLLIIMNYPGMMNGSPRITELASNDFKRSSFVQRCTITILMLFLHG